MKRLAMTTIGLAALSLPSIALADSTIIKGYGGKAGAPVSNVLGTGTTHHSGSLPFTGLNLAVFAAAGLLLVCLGIVLNRAARRSSNEY